jgi:hypothetical protein
MKIQWSGSGGYTHHGGDGLSIIVTPAFLDREFLLLRPRAPELARRDQVSDAEVDRVKEFRSTAYAPRSRSSTP